MMPLFIMPMMLFAGFLGNREEIWIGLRWIEYLSPFKFGFNALIHNEFKETYFRPSPIDSLNLNMVFNFKNY